MKAREALEIALRPHEPHNAPLVLARALLTALAEARETEQRLSVISRSETARREIKAAWQLVRKLESGDGEVGSGD